MQVPAISRLGRVALDLLYPPKCVICDAGGVFLCEACIATLPSADDPRCDRCWLPLNRDGECPAYVAHPSALNRLRSVYRYEAGVRHVVHRFKFGGQSSLSPDLGRLMAEAYERHEMEADVIVPVPLTASRRRIRGYNQAQLMAKEVARRIELPVQEALLRRGRSDAQALSSSAEVRRRNVEGVFTLARDAQVGGARVLLIDDVATTGATLGACAGVLLEAGASGVSALTLARED